jgi:transcriptional regulator with XRE-family HTH domain
VFEIGNTLREARVRRNLTLQQVEEDTKIRVKYVQAMENEDFDVMPGATYVKGFLRTYSQYLALDPEVMLDEYRSRGVKTAEIQEPFGGVSMLGAPRRHRGRNTVVFVAVICLLVLGVIWILGRGSDTPPSTKPGALGITSPSPSVSKPAKPQKTTTPVVKGELRVSAPDAEIWLEVRRDGSAGAVLFSGTVKKGKTRVFVGDVLWLRLGNPSAVRLRIEGREIKPMTDADPVDYIVKNGKLERQG